MTLPGIRIFGQKTRCEILDIFLPSRKRIGEKDYHAELCRLRGLKAHKAKPDPPLRAARAVPDARHEDQT